MVDLAQLDSFLNARLLGQAEAIGDFSSALVRAECGPRRGGRPRAFLLLLGPTGTGKTEMVNLAAAYLYGDAWRDRLERFDMGEFQHPDSVKRLLGAPDQRPLLGAAVARLNSRGGGILLLDEIEKAFPDLLTVLLSFDSARTTMFDGTTHDLSSLIVVLTSNLGAAEVSRMECSGYSAISRKLRHAAEERFRKEGVARFTAVICTTVLSYEVQQRITRSLVDREVAIQTTHLRRSVIASPEVVRFLVGKGFSPDLGARNVRNCVERYIGDALRVYAVERERAFTSLRTVGGVTDRWSGGIRLSVEGEVLTAAPIERSAALARVLLGQPEAVAAVGAEPGGTPGERVPSRLAAWSFSP